MATKKPKPRRENPATTYLRSDIKRRTERLASSDPRLSVSRLIEESLEMSLPDLERKYGRGAAMAQ